MSSLDLVLAGAGCNCKTSTSWEEMGKSVAATNEKVSNNNHVPDDLALSILSKLPLKSLKRFGCVRKSWALLFKDPHFMSIYRNNFISRNHSYYDDSSLLLYQVSDLAVSDDDQFHSTLYLLSGERFESGVKLDLPFQELHNYSIILGSGSINGTFCLSIDETRLVLWNPATKEFKIIPPSPVESIPYQDAEVTLHGFGYDHVKDDYKVIRFVDFSEVSYDYPDDISYHDKSPSPLWEIYSLRSNSWRKLDVDMPIALRTSEEGGRVYIDGMCHWWGQGVLGSHESDNEVSDNEVSDSEVSDSEESDFVDESYLVSFDLSKEVFFTTLMPSVMDDNFDFKLEQSHLVVVLNGSIALISYYDETTTFHISILGEIGVKESWIKLFIVGPLSCVEHPIGAGKKGDIFFMRKDKELVRFDLSTQMIEELGVKGMGLCDQLVIYKKSLLPIEG